MRGRRRPTTTNKEEEMMIIAGGLDAFIKTSSWLVASMAYARFASSLTKPGNLRLLSLLPVAILLPSLPWYFASINLRGTAAFFLAWLGVFKLLLLAFGLGPLSPSLPLPTFIAVASLPIQARPAGEPADPLAVPTLIKLALILLLLSLYHRHKPQIHPRLRLLVFCLYICLFVELILASATFLASSLLGLALEPQTDSPYKSASLQDFWGRRWNLTATSILRASVYRPVRSLLGTAAGVMAVFLVSGLMHEAIVYYMTVEVPTGEITLFFLLQGLGTMSEATARRAGWRAPHPAARVALTLAFLAATAFWLFIPPMLRAGADEKVLEESAAVLGLVADAGGDLLRWVARILRV